MLSARFAVVVSSFACLLFTGREASAQPRTSGPDVGFPLEFAVSPRVRDLPPQAKGPGPAKERPMHVPPRRPHQGNVTDPVLQNSTSTPAISQSLNQWEGLGAGFPGFTVTALPPDTNAAIGPSHIVQWVNNAFVVFNKQGAQVLAPVDDASFWGVLSTCYQFGGFSDPIVQYDRAADRWLVGEVAIPLVPPILGQFAQCFAVSTGPDPTGSYFMWAYGFGSDLNDYPKIGVWPDGYYVTWNMFQNAANFMGSRACSFDRSAMLSGAAAPARVCFQLSTAYDSLLPADLDGAAAPPGGSPNFLMNINTATSELNLWKFHVDYATPGNSTFTGPISIPGVAPFNAPCLSTQDCVPQPGTTESLDALGDRLMYRLAYRNFGDHESIVANHTILAAGGNTGVRWYEVRSPNGSPAIYQQGSFAPDTDYRWMGSIAMDKKGNIGLGYSVASGVTYPSIRYTGWESGNPLGTLQAETSMVAGGGAQTGYNRWGDYSAMRIDPSNDCIFWYTQEYQATTQSANWNTRIGSFQFPSCSQTAGATNTSLTSLPNASTYGQSVTFTATVSPVSGPGTPTGSVIFKDGSTTIGSGPLSGGVATLAISTLTTGSHSITAVYAGDASFTGSTSPVLNQMVNQAGTSTALGSNPSTSTYGQNVTLTATVSPAGATGSVQFRDGGSVIGSAALSGGQAQISTSNLSGGGHTLTASYGGDTNYLASVSPGTSQTVNPAGTTTSVSSSSSTSTYGQTVTFTATVSHTSGSATPTGTVQFKDGATVIGSSGVNGSGVATFSISTLPVGPHTISAQYSGDGNYSGSGSSTIGQTVNKANTTTTVQTSGSPSKVGQTVTFTATISQAAATGTVEFLDGSKSLSTVPVSGGHAVFSTASLSSGKHSIKARYSGDSNLNGSTSSSLTQNVQRK